MIRATPAGDEIDTIRAALCLVASIPLRAFEQRARTSKRTVREERNDLVW